MKIVRKIIWVLKVRLIIDSFDRFVDNAVFARTIDEIVQVIKIVQKKIFASFMWIFVFWSMFLFCFLFNLFFSFFVFLNKL